MNGITKYTSNTPEVNVENSEKQNKNNKKNRFMLFIVIAVTISFAGGIVTTFVLNAKKKNEVEVISVEKLKQIINVSELSTSQAVYNGIAQVMNKEDENKVDYYVSYEAKVNVGLEFDQIEIDVDNENKKIIVTIPEIEITDVNVDITSLDYIFCNEKANTSTVSQEAYRACIADVTEESKGEKEIYNLAEQNAKNIVKALINPFVEQLDASFELEIR